jgi:hypothetical protein
MSATDAKLEELARRWARARRTQVRQSTDQVPSKKSTKKHGKMQNTFDRSMRGCPGGGIAKMAWAAETGCRTTNKVLSAAESMRNANTTQGSYISTKVV